MAALVTYDGNIIVPAPLYAITHSINRTPNGAILSYLYSITLKGTLLPNKGSPNSSGTYSSSNADQAFITDAAKIQSIVKKQALLRGLFFDESTVASNVAKWFEINNSGTIIKCQAMTVDVAFDADINVNKSDYTIVITTNKLILDDGDLDKNMDIDSEDYNLRTASDVISISSQNDYDNTYTISRTVSAQSYKSMSAEPGGEIEPWQNAKSWVSARVVSTSTLASLGSYTLVAPTSDYEFLNTQTQENVDTLGGSYSLTITWSYCKSALNDVTDEWTSSYSSDTRQNNYSGTLTGGYNRIYKVSGTITSKVQSSAGYTASVTAWNAIKSALKTRALSTDGVFNGFSTSGNVYGPYNLSLSENKRTGVISYSAEFKEKKITLVGSIFSDVDISVSENTKESSIVEIPIIGRRLGPIIQNLYTTNTKKKTISATFSFLDSSFTHKGPATIRPLAKAVLINNSIYPAIVGYEVSYWVASFSDSIDIFNGTYTYNTTLVFAGEDGEP